ncbi:MAG: DNA/RNA nuclease SfsA [Pseudomonadota bacterium]
MRFQTPLIPAILLRRYNRFLADARLDDGRVVNVHCPNPGSMMGLKDEGARIWLEPNDDPKKKLKFGWRLVELSDGHWCGIDTTMPNRIVREALEDKLVVELSAYDTFRPEVKYGDRSRVDFLLSRPGRPDAYVEVKNVHLRREGDWAEFPDSVTDRGTRHLRDLIEVRHRGCRAVMFYLVQRTDCARLRMAGDLDPTYAETFAQARAAGVEVLCYDVRISLEEIVLGRALPVPEAPDG